MTDGMIFDIKEFTVHDGPGIRVTVFLKGCGLRCIWCHNPEGLSSEPELMIRQTLCRHCGKCNIKCNHEECQPFARCLKACPDGLIQVVGERVNAKVLADRMLQYREFLEKNHGGITISGGEPLLQPVFLLDLLQALKPMHIAIETSGFGKPDIFQQVIALADLILFDIKHTNAEIHKQITGTDNRIIMENLYQLIQSEKKFIVRIPLIPGINDDRDNMKQIAHILKEAKGLERVELLPYNPFTGAKYKMINREYAYHGFGDRKIEYQTDILDEINISYCIL